jgi:hypothetical protein
MMGRQIPIVGDIIRFFDGDRKRSSSPRGNFYDNNGPKYYPQF